MSKSRLVLALSMFWLAIGAIYLWASVRQMDALNLSPAAGGQYPYLACAQRMAEEGVTHYLGDRNRMPLYSAVLSLCYTGDWDSFVDRSKWFAIISSMVLLAGVGAVAYRYLSVASATALTLAAAWCVFLPKASFVQAELAYYVLLLAAWLACCGTLHRPTTLRALLAGVLLGVAYLTKASALPALAVFMLVLAVWAVLSHYGRSGASRYESGNAAGSLPSESPSGTSDARTPPTSDTVEDALDRGDSDIRAGAFRSVRWWRAAALSALTFLVVVFPYLRDNHARFGRFFYNVNSSFFMWCDEWDEAKSFADTFRVEEQYPAAPPDLIPGPVVYWRTHDGAQMQERISTGLRALTSLARRGAYTKYALLAAALAVMATMLAWRSRTAAWRGWIPSIALSAVLASGYLLIYAWYAPVAFGDRFLLSLFLPLMFSALWCTDKLSETVAVGAANLVSRRARHVPGTILIACLSLEGAWRLSDWPPPPTREFVLFFHNEARELQQAGKMTDARRGFEGGRVTRSVVRAGAPCAGDDRADDRAV